MKNKYSIIDLKAIAHSRNGQCHSEEYIGMQSKLEWECELGHRWSSTPNSIIYAKSWCPHCAGNTKLNLDQIKLLAKAKGGQCLSTSYQNSKTKMLWKCTLGHQWLATVFSIKVRRSWCPECYKLTINTKHHEKNKQK